MPTPEQKAKRLLKIKQMRNTPILPINSLSKINNIDTNITPTNFTKDKKNTPTPTNNLVNKN